jgi:hypothetical protein
MALVDLTDDEREVVFRAMCCIATGRLIPDWEFHTLFGIELFELEAVIAQWPDVDDSDAVTRLAINNSMNNLLGYPHRMSGELWWRQLRVSRSEVARIFSKWRGQSASNYFDGLM